MSQIRQRVEGNLNREFLLEFVKREDKPNADAAADGDVALKENVVLTFAFSSETPYLRSNYWDDPWLEVLGHKEGECDLSRLSDGAPVLANHGRYGTGDTPLLLIGTTIRAWLENGRGMVEVKLSRREGMEGLLQDILDGIVRNVSVGYQILERILIKANPEGMPDEYRVTKWLPMEVSLVDMPADATVGLERSHEQPAEGTRYRVIDLPDPGVSTKGSNMDQVTQTAPGSVNQPDIEAATRAAAETATTAERTRANDIRIAVRSANLDAAYADELITSGVSADAARSAVLAKLAERTTAQGITGQANIQTIVDETDVRREMMANSIMHRVNSKIILVDGAKQYRGMALIDLARDALEVAGVKTRGMSRMEIAQRSFETTSDLPAVLANVANKSLRTAYETAPRTFKPWARQSTAPDFKQMSRVALSDAPALEGVTEAGEFKRGTFSDGKEVYSLATYGKIIGMSRQAIINDDLSSFTRLPMLMANAAANIESDTVYGILTANAALADTVALFSVTHKNLTTGPGTVLSVASLGVGRAAMRVQTSPGGAVLNLAPKYLIVPAALETLANQYTSADFVSAKSGDINPFKGNLEVIVEGRLDAASALSWYLAADYNAIDTIEYSYLEGQEGAYMETRQGWDVDGMEFKVRLDFAAKAIDYRGLYKNAGA
jgi:hypothetical protein